MTRTIESVFVRISLVCCLAWLSGCSSTVLTRQGEAAFAPAPPMVPAAPIQNRGSIYVAGYATPWFEDIKARQVGDLLHVILDEQTDASKTASTGIKKDNTTNISAPTVLGKSLELSGRPLSTNLTSANDFSGEADSSQSNKLEGSITVTVSQVLKNGNLVVQGEKWIAINQGDEYVRLRGIVRSVDIRPDNSVLSKHIGNAQITYRGKGAPDEANTMGWLARFFNTPLWPY